MMMKSKLNICGLAPVWPDGLVQISSKFSLALYQKLAHSIKKSPTVAENFAQQLIYFKKCCYLEKLAQMAKFCHSWSHWLAQRCCYKLSVGQSVKQAKEKQIKENKNFCWTTNRTTWKSSFFDLQDPFNRAPVSSYIH